jgi:hypothetical protein
MRIIQKKKEEHRTHNRADSDHIWRDRNNSVVVSTQESYCQKITGA